MGMEWEWDLGMGRGWKWVWGREWDKVGNRDGDRNVIGERMELGME